MSKNILICDISIFDVNRISFEISFKIDQLSQNQFLKFIEEEIQLIESNCDFRENYDRLHRY